MTSCGGRAVDVGAVNLPGKAGKRRSGESRPDPSVPRERDRLRSRGASEMQADQDRLTGESPGEAWEEVDRIGRVAKRRAVHASGSNHGGSREAEDPSGTWRQRYNGGHVPLKREVSY